MQSRQQPPACNTRLSVVARNALKLILGEDQVAEIERQAEAGKLMLADLDSLAYKGKDIATWPTDADLRLGEPAGSRFGVPVGAPVLESALIESRASRRACSFPRGGRPWDDGPQSSQFRDNGPECQIPAPRGGPSRAI